jgi:superfamily II DNA or RNA helicase
MIKIIGRKTLIIVHRKGILAQWLNEIKKFLPNTTVAIIGGTNKYDQDKINNAFICIALFQSLSETIITRLNQHSFSFAIFDEVHHLSAPTYYKVLLQIYNIPYILGMSATPNTSKSDIFIHSIGPIIQSTTKPHKFIINYHPILIKIPDKEKIPDYYNNLDLYSKLENKALCCEKWKTNIEQIITNICTVLPTGILILSNRISVIQTLYYITKPILTKFNRTSCLFHGEIQNLPLALYTNVIFASISLVKEAFNIPHLRSIILISPISTLIEQVLGRILRECPEEVRVFMDIYTDIHPMSLSMQKKRQTYLLFNSGHVINKIQTIVFD